MNDLIHFITGLAWAACCPGVLEQARSGTLLPLLLGGAGALLPDTIDRWQARLRTRCDVHLVPDPANPSPALVATALADSLGACQDDRLPRRLCLHPTWAADGAPHRYLLTFDPPVIRVGHPVRRPAEAPLPAGVVVDPCSAWATRDGDALTLAVTPLGERGLRVTFLPGKRGWSHSLLFVAAWAIGAGLVAGWAASLAAGGATLIHVLLNQAGYMGTSLLYPWRRERIPGWQLRRPGSPVAWAPGWLAALTLAWTLDLFRWIVLSLPQLLFFGWLLPLAALTRAARPRRG
jgi:hypothetical protein